jgi:hypothetical protein
MFTTNTELTELNLMIFISPSLFKHKIDGSHYKGEGYKIVPAEWFFQIKDGKEAEYSKGDYLLDSFKLETIESSLFSKPVGRNHKAVFKKSNSPTDKDHLPYGNVLIFQMSVPGKGHKCVRNK